jgi:hypothetical protein
MEELDVPTTARVVGDALVEGFARTLDVSFDLESSPRVASIARRG